MMGSKASVRPRMSVADCRRAARAPVAMVANARGTDRWHTKVEIIDLSCLGFRMCSRRLFLVGEAAVVQLPGLEPIPFTVVWADRDIYGAHFTRALHPAVGDFLSARFPRPYGA